MNLDHSFDVLDNNLKITITPLYNEDLSSFNNFIWEYTISMENKGYSSLQIIEKSYQIIGANGFLLDVQVNDIIIDKPVIRPGEALEYKSFANLTTSSGVIRGKCTVLKDGKEFEFDIPAFSLDNPNYNLTAH